MCNIHALSIKHHRGNLKGGPIAQGYSMHFACRGLEFPDRARTISNSRTGKVTFLSALDSAGQDNIELGGPAVFDLA